MVPKMSNENHLTKYFNRLQAQIEQAQKDNLPIEPYVKKQIQVLQEAHDEFVLAAQKEGMDMADPHVGEIEVQQYTLMKDLATKIGMSPEKYDKLIKDVQIRIFGEENYKRFFEGK